MPSKIREYLSVRGRAILRKMGNSLVPILITGHIIKKNGKAVPAASLPWRTTPRVAGRAVLGFVVYIGAFFGIAAER